ncbi:MAG: hypothetical protein PUB81_02725 [Clostridiales bacterium]|nr:hypothetical protein [Clostridiales bacterium]
MIEFKGRLSNKCKKYLIKSSWQLGFFVVIAVCIPFIILSIVLSIMDDWVYLVMLLPIGLFIFFASLKPETRAYRELYGKNGKIYDGELTWHITIERDIMFAEGIQRSETKNLSNVKKVVDMGEWYKIYFYFPYKSNLFICQKDLLVKGTIEEFEELFSDKIIRKKFNNNINNEPL